MSDRILVLAVDRDNDLGEKTGIKGPLFGKDAVLKAANKMGLADPEDSDFNTMFEAIRVYNEVRKTHKSEVAVLTGHKQVGLKSDTIISKQLNQVLKKFNATGVFLITDGAEDDYIIPIIQSKVPIISVKRVIVRQAEHLESTYFKIKDFITESIKEPKMARTVFGLPAIILLLLGIFGIEGGRIIVFLFGAYLLIKGFKLEGFFTETYDELRTSFTRRRLAFFIYTISIIIGVLSIYRGYNYMLNWVNVGIFETLAAFFSASIYLLWITITTAWIARTIGVRGHKKGRIIAIPMFVFAISIVIFSATEIILIKNYNLFNFIISIVAGFAIISVAAYFEKKYK